MDRDKIKGFAADAKRSISLKVSAAESGHAWPVMSHTISSFELLELASLAIIGTRIVEIAASERGGAVHADQIDAVIARAQKPMMSLAPNGRVEFVAEAAAQPKGGA